MSIARSRRRERGDILPALRAGEDAAVRMRSKAASMLSGLATNRRAKERIKGTLPSEASVVSPADDPLVGVDPDVHLVAVHAHFGRADLGDLQFGRR